MSQTVGYKVRCTLLPVDCETSHHSGMTKQHNIGRRTSGHLVCAVSGAIALLATASSVTAQWASKPAPSLPRSVLDQAISGSVVLGLVFDQSGRVKDATVLRSSGVVGLDSLAAEGAKRWQLAPAALRPSDMTTGRRHLVKFFQDTHVARRVEPFQAFWKEL